MCKEYICKFTIAVGLAFVIVLFAIQIIKLNVSSMVCYGW